MIETVHTTGSTNADLLARLESGEQIAEGYWLRAEQQTAGRGRSGREWLSRPGNLYTSTVVHIGANDPPAHTLSLVTGVAVWQVLKGQVGIGPDLFLKWPNDVLAGNAKIAGILLERRGDTVVVGIGVNVSFAPELPDRATTCIRDLNPRNDNGPPELLGYLATEMAASLSQWRSEGLEALLARWTQRGLPIGASLSVKDSDGEATEGSFAGLDEGGSLLLRLANGVIHTIHAGDVSLIAEGNS